MRIQNPEKVSRYYQALLNRDQSYVGIFYVGVVTTGVFCISSCRARKPKPENVEFYCSFKDALNAGFRPCKICRPTENANEAPAPVAAAIELVRNNPKQKISDYELHQRGISPEQTRRWFKQNYGMTFQAFQRMYRINIAYRELKDGRTATATAFETGYESLSGFGYTFKQVMGRSPTNCTEDNVIVINRFTTPLGPMFVGATEQGVCLLEFVDRRMLETEFKDLQRRLQATIVTGENEHTNQAQQQLHEYFAGTRKEFTLTLHTPGTEFQQQVWQVLHDIPYGETRSYQAQAESIGNPKAVRAVASANGCNRVAIVIPCHRVIGKNGTLTGYGGGLERKQWLLEHERRHLG
ncbi:MAG: methylated-DNA--[protein]-cysteine S-methyltransferase [Idiomarina sp.]